MKHWGAYRLALRFLPAKGALRASDLTREQTEAAVRTLRKHRCVGAALCLFDEAGEKKLLTFGNAHLTGEAVGADTVFRAASVSKFVTGLGVMKLSEAGRVNLDADVNGLLPFPLRHPKQPDRPITLRALMTHTAGIRDSEAYNAGIARGAKLSEIMGDPRVWEGTPGRWEYSNLGAGIVGVLLEAVTGRDFETLMQETVFGPLGIAATYYPRKVRGDLADAVRILPRSKTPNFDAASRRARPLPGAYPDAENHYNLAHGALCVSAPALASLGKIAMIPGFLLEDSLNAMRKETAPFGERARNLSQGLFTFILNEPAISPRPIYGHQGMAYGAVHGLFFDPALGRGLALLTTGASEARRGVLADLNFDLLALFLGDQHGHGG